ncbi:crotonase/enoyl-CoA hydratase family protein [Pseudomarimonas arenosa]|uniref:Crotonase/enoyl-CoA hydratase family protein n=1 Tax=Pseudomarimonas arenosa TaxID=2774145 RepID=A0AAW3ZSI4_9GAMM|nr:crotonase/enoyl-CoA hydratase family protein [Pseudomarimonas arenosa]MBD8527156.1 crotonase/enoyl-CoA hydratase family protein [Pseudomarimonas arenosa]
MTNAALTVERHGHLLLIGFNRADKRNAFGLDSYRELALAYGELDRDPELRCGVLFGHGPHFTAGLDLTAWAPELAKGRMPDLPEQAIEPFGLDEQRRLSKPMVVAASGVSYTVAVELMLAADVRVAASDCRFGQLEVRRGFFACGGATVRLSQEIGWGNAMDVLLSGREFSAEEAHRWGLVQRVCPPGEHLPLAIEIASGIAAAAPLGVQASLRLARLARRDGPEAGIAALFPALDKVMRSEDASEAVRAFEQRRQAVFRGR